MMCAWTKITYPIRFNALDRFVAVESLQKMHRGQKDMNHGNNTTGIYKNSLDDDNRKKWTKSKRTTLILFIILWLVSRRSSSSSDSLVDEKNHKTLF